MAYLHDEDIVTYDECMAIKSCRDWIQWCRLSKYAKAKSKNAAKMYAEEQKFAKKKERSIEKGRIAVRIHTNKKMLERCRLYGIKLTKAQRKALINGALQKDVLTAEQNKAYRSAVRRH